MVGGDDEVSRFRDPAVNEDYDVQLRLDEGDRNDPDDDLAALRAARSGGGLVRLDNLVARSRRRRPPRASTGSTASGR